MSDELKIVSDVITHMPEPSPFVSSEVDGVNNPQPARSNDIFSPDLHATDSSGKPVFNKDGSFRKKRGPKPGNARTGKVSTDASVPSEQSAEQAGKATAEIIFAVGIAIGGEEWKPIVSREHGINEPEQMASAFANYYASQGITNVPPWAILAIALSSYSLPRLRMPKTQSRLVRLWGWLKGKFPTKK